MKVIISGTHSGTNPGPGIGVAQSLRLAFPTIQLVAKEHTAQSSGLYHPVFNDVWISREWGEVSLESHIRQIKQESVGHTYYLSGIDVEVEYLARNGGGKNILSPSLEALQQVRKPIQRLSVLPPLFLPEVCLADRSHKEILQFMRFHSMSLWVKGAVFDAYRISSWNEFTKRKQELEERWGKGVFLQEHISGREIAMAFCAHQGKLLDAVFMRKRASTHIGKTWSAEIEDIPETLYRHVRDLVKKLQWTGGGEIECIEDVEGKLWLMDWNPRFPAWIYGAALCGRNLPGTLLSHVTGVKAQSLLENRTQFTRVVTEISLPNNKSIPMTPLKDEKWHGEGIDGKTVGNIRQLSKHMQPRKEQPIFLAVSKAVASELKRQEKILRKTPQRFFLESIAAERFTYIKKRTQELSRKFHVDVSCAYSVKTNPADSLLQIARKYGYRAEVISRAEYKKSMKQGFSSAGVVYNGPVPYVQKTKREKIPGTLIADSVEALETYLSYKNSVVIGARLRTPLFSSSRFGINTDSFEEFSRFIAVLKKSSLSKIILSSHIQSSRVGLEPWGKNVQSLVYFANVVQTLTGISVTALDMGGGWHPDDIKKVFSEVLPVVMHSAVSSLPNLTQIILEPGKLLADPCAMLGTMVLEVREKEEGCREIIVDASIAELPMSVHTPRSIYTTHGRRYVELGSGNDRILGRLCMEDDILARSVALPPTLVRGDRIFFADAGGYDTSMSYDFGLGNG